jgi:hypothetical protein
VTGIDRYHFLAAIWGDGWHSLCWSPAEPGDQRPYPFAHFATPEELLDRADALGERDIWFGAHPLKAVPERGRGGRADVAAVLGLHADLDWLDPMAHKNAELPTEAELRRRLARLPAEVYPSVTINSGHGLQPWWFLTHPVTPDEGQDLLDRLTATLEALGLENGRRDLASVLRLPGSMNCKGIPVRVEFEIGDTARRLDPDVARDGFADPTSRTGAGTSRPAGGSVTDKQRRLRGHLEANYEAELVRVTDGTIFLRYPDASAEHSATVWTGERGDALVSVFSTNWVKDFPEAGRKGKHFVLGWDDRLYLADDDASWIKESPSPAGNGTNASSMPGQGRRLTIDSVEKLAPRRARWLWDARLPLSALTLLGGREGIGKSILAYTLAARVTRGLLEGELHGRPRSVVVVATEDSWAHTIIPRLIVAGADRSLIYRLTVTAPADQSSSLVLPHDLEAFHEATTSVDAALVLLDPLMSRLDSALDSHRDKEVRQALEPLVARAEVGGYAVLGLIHVNKGTSNDPLTMLMASRAFAAVARAVLFTTLDPEQPGMRLLGQPKNNLGRTDLPTLMFDIVEKVAGNDPDDGKLITTGALQWCGISQRTIQVRVRT